MSERALSKVQWGLETVNGTAVAADTMLAVNHPPIRQDREAHMIRYDLGLRADATHSHIYQYLVQDSLNFNPAYFQALPLLFSCGILGNVTPAEQTGSQNDMLWAFAPSWTASNSIDSGTLELGDNTQAYEVEYVMFDRYRISGRITQDQGESPVSIDASYFGRQLTATAVTGGLSAPSVEIINAKKTRVYRDTSWANLGNTELTSLVRGFDLDIITGVHPKFLGSANQYFEKHGESYIGAMLSLTMERGTASDAIWDLAQANTQSFVRLDIQGSQIGTGDNHTLSVDIAGVWTEPVPLSEEDQGNNIDVAVLKTQYDFTGSEMLDVNVTTDVAAI